MSLHPVHATVAARPGRDGWIGVVIRGPSGAGKSDLALRLRARGWALVADDYAHVWASAGALYATAPTLLAGRMEVRGLGVVAAPSRFLCRLVLGVECVSGRVERLPEPERAPLAGLDLPLLRLDPRTPSAVDVVAAALDAL